MSGLAESAHQFGLAAQLEIVTSADAHAVHFVGGDMSHAEEAFHWQPVQEILGLARFDDEKSIGLVLVGSYFGEEFVVRHACGGRETGGLEDALLDFASHEGGGAHVLWLTVTSRKASSSERGSTRSV